MSIILLTKNSLNKSLFIEVNNFIFKLLNSKDGKWISFGDFETIKDGLYYPGVFNMIDKNTYILNTTIIDQWISKIVKDSETIEIKIISEDKLDLHNKILNEYTDKIKYKKYSYNNKRVDKYLITSIMLIKTC